MEKFYSALGLAKSGLLPYKSKATILKLIGSGQLKATSLGSGLGKRYIISDKAIQKYLARFDQDPRDFGHYKYHPDVLSKKSK